MKYSFLGKVVEPADQPYFVPPLRKFEGLFKEADVV